MGSNIGDFPQLAENLKDEYENRSVFGEWVSRSVSDGTASLDYYRGGETVAEMSSSFFVPITASKFAGDLVETEKKHVVRELRAASDRGDIDVTSLPDYSLDGFAEGFGRVDEPSLVLLPTKRGRSDKLDEQLGRVDAVRHGETDVDIEFVSSGEFDLDRGIAIDADRVRVHQIPAGEMETPSDFSAASDGDFSDHDDLTGPDDLVQLVVEESDAPGERSFLYRTLFSELDGVSADTACVIELPD